MAVTEGYRSGGTSPSPILKGKIDNLYAEAQTLSETIQEIAARLDISPSPISAPSFEKNAPIQPPPSVVLQRVERLEDVGGVFEDMRACLRQIKDVVEQI